jgi:hypothetical protein
MSLAHDHLDISMSQQFHHGFESHATHDQMGGKGKVVLGKMKFFREGKKNYNLWQISPGL